MLLAIDAGNTNTLFAVFDGDNVRAQWRAETSASRTADEYLVWLTQLMALKGMKPDDVTGAIIATVVPQALFPLRQLCENYFCSHPMVVGDAAVGLGIDLNVDRPSAVGADRIVNAIAAHEKHKGPLIVIDFGTATTFDIVAENGDYEGGIIAPGVNLSLEALNQAAAKLPRIAVERPQSIIGKDTVPAMQSGVYWGYISLIEGLVERIKREYEAPMTVVATGGLANLFRHNTLCIDHVDSDLTILGLKMLYDRNRDHFTSNTGKRV